MISTPAAPAADDLILEANWDDLESSLLDRPSQGVERTSSINKAGHYALKIDLDAHLGLRGALSCWIVLFHCFRSYRGAGDVDFQGSSLMPMFFMLSGFSLAATYNGASGSSWRSFFSNRLARVLPVYLLMSLLVLPMWFTGFGDAAPGPDMLPSAISTVALSSTMLCFLYGSPLDGPSWTVQSLVWMWMLFPFFMRRARKMKSSGLCVWIVWLFYLQLLLLGGGFALILIYTTWGFWPAFCAATMHPLTRMPLFLMGLYAGELCHRAALGEAAVSEFSERGGKAVILHEHWPAGVFLPLFHCCRRIRLREPSAADLHNNYELRGGNGHGDAGLLRGVQDLDSTGPRDGGPSSVEREEAFWTGRALWLSMGMLVATLGVSAANSFAGRNIAGALWLQAIAPFAQLGIIVALTRQSTRCIVHRALTTNLAKFLGNISMTMYLSHFPIIWYVEWGFNGYSSIAWPSGAIKEVTALDTATDDATRVAWDDARQLQLLGIPIVCGITLVISTVIYYGFEEPLRRALRKAKG